MYDCIVIWVFTFETHCIRRCQSVCHSCCKEEKLIIGPHKINSWFTSSKKKQLLRNVYSIFFSNPSVCVKTLFNVLYILFRKANANVLGKLCKPSIFSWRYFGCVLPSSGYYFVLKSTFVSSINIQCRVGEQSSLYAITVIILSTSNRIPTREQ